MSQHPGRPLVHVLGAVMVLAAGMSQTACAHHADPATAAAPQRLRVSPSNGPITYEEMQTLADHDAYAAIELLRPTFLKNRGRTSFYLNSPTTPDVFVDGIYYGPTTSLRNLSAKDIFEVRYINVGDAAVKYGTGHTAGVIDVATRP